jgi:ABC-type amino acid transport substrate-binding protein
MPTAPADHTKSRSRLFHQLYWLIPLAIAIVGTTAALVVDPAAGAALASILALPVGVVAAVAAILALPTVRERVERTPPTGRRRYQFGQVLPTLVVLALVTWAAVAMSRPDGEAEVTEQLSGTVRIGISGTIPGWSEKNGDSYQGFEIDLIDFLREKYRFRAELIELTPDERVAALAEGKVDLVIANLEVNEKREQRI